MSGAVLTQLSRLASVIPSRPDTSNTSPPSRFTCVTKPFDEMKAQAEQYVRNGFQNSASL